MTDARQIPSDVLTEQAVLGLLLLRNSLIDQAAGEIETHHFYDPLHQRIYENILYLQTEGAVTPLLLHAMMKNDDGLGEVGGLSYISGLAQAAPATNTITEYARVLRDLSVRRDYLAIGEDLIAGALASSREVRAEVLGSNTVEALLAAGTSVQRKILTPYEHAMESLKQVEAMQLGKDAPLVLTRLRTVDEEIGGLGEGDFVVIAGKPGMGKSALMGGLAWNFVKPAEEEERVPTIIFSLEMTAQQWTVRTVTDIDFDYHPARPIWYSRVRNGRLSNDEFDRFAEAARHMHGRPFEIHDGPHTLGQIAAKARAFVAKHRAKNPKQKCVVVVDYVQIIDPGEVPRGQSREQTVGGFARGLKALATRLRVPVIAGSQLNEDDKGRSTAQKRPQASDVRESKAIYNEADWMFAPYREYVGINRERPAGCMDGDPEWLAWRARCSAVRHRMDFLILKARHGRETELQLYCDMAASAIRDEEPAGANTGAQNDKDLLELAGVQ